MRKKPHRPAFQRLAGIELMRGFAAFGVIFIHSGLVIHNRTTPAAGDLRALFIFVVPFFLMTSFFFAIQSEEKKALGWKEWLRNRAARLGLPYLVWSGVYLGLRMLKFYFGHQGRWIGELFQDPWALLLNGGSSVALYFLPMLFVGLLVIHALRQFLCRGSTWTLGLALVLAVAANQMLQLSGNSYDVSTSRGFAAFAPGLNEFAPTRLGLAAVALAIRCSPLILAAALAARYLSPARAGFIFALGIVFGLFGAYVNSRWGGDVPTDLPSGVGAFFIGWSLSQVLQPTKLITTIGAFSFGVYLVHQVVLEAMQVVVSRMRPHDLSLVGVPVLLCLTAGVYAISMMIVGLASYGGPWLRKIFALNEPQHLS